MSDALRELILPLVIAQAVWPVPPWMKTAHVADYRAKYKCARQGCENEANGSGYCCAACYKEPKR